MIKSLKNCIQCQSVCNKLHVDSLLSHFKLLHRLLVSKRILFKKVVIMLKGQVRGTICNVPINRFNTNFNVLPLPVDSSGGVVVVKLKRKAEYTVHVLPEPVKQRFAQWFISYLRNCNHLYRDVKIDLGNIPSSLKKL